MDQLSFSFTPMAQMEPRGRHTWIGWLTIIAWRQTFQTYQGEMPLTLEIKTG